VTPASAIPALSQQSNEAMTAMSRPLSTVALAASVWAAVLAAPAQAKDSDAVPAVSAVSASAVTARAQTTAPAVKRVRKASTQPRRVATVATPGAYHPQCFLFWCSAGGRHFNLLMLGVAY
jgi:hypothetical protein